MGQGVPAEDAVEGVEEPGPQAQEDAGEGDGQPAVKHAADTRAAQQGQQQGQELFPAHRLLPERGGEEHHEGRGRVQQDGGRRQGAELLAGEVAHGEQQHTHHTGAEKVFQAPPLHPENAPVLHGEEEDQQSHAPQVPHHDDGIGRKARRHQFPVPQPDHAPQGRRRQNRGHGRGSFLCFHKNRPFYRLSPVRARRKLAKIRNSPNPRLKK